MLKQAVLIEAWSEVYLFLKHEEQIRQVNGPSHLLALFPVFSSANLYTLSWGSSLAVKFKSVSWKIITRVEMKWAKLEPSAQAWGISRNHNKQAR